jgi:hypothetical protein
LHRRRRVRQRRNQRRHMHNVPEVLWRGVLLSGGCDDSDWRRDGWRLPDRSVQHRGWYYLNYICVHAVPRGDLWFCYHTGDGGVLGHVHSRILLHFGLRVRQRRNQRWHMHNVAQVLQRGVLLPRERDDRNWRRDGWRLPDRSLQYRGRCNLKNSCMHAVPRGDLRRCYNAYECGLLGHVHSRVLLPRGLRVRQRRV